MQVAINPHTPLGTEQQVVSVLEKSNKLWSSLAKSTTLTPFSSGQKLLSVILSDISSIACQLYNIDFLTPQYSQLHYYDLGLPYSIVTNEGHPLLDHQKLVFHTSPSDSAPNAPNIHVSDLREDLPLVLSDLSWQQYISDVHPVANFMVDQGHPTNVDEDIPDYTRVQEELTDELQKVALQICEQFPQLDLVTMDLKLRELLDFRLPLTSTIELTERIVKHVRPAWLLCWNDWYPVGQVVRSTCQEYEIPTYVFQHGQFLLEPIYQFSATDRFFVFNSVEQHKLNLIRTQPTSTSVLGTPFREHTTNKSKKNGSRILVILQLLSHSPEFRELLKLIDEVIKSGYEVSFRPHPRDTIDWASISHNVIVESSEEPLFDCFTRFDYIIGLNSTALLEAFLCGYRTLEYIPSGSSLSYLSYYSKEDLGFRTAQQLLDKLQSYPDGNVNMVDLVDRTTYLQRIVNEITINQ